MPDLTRKSADIDGLVIAPAQDGQPMKELLRGVLPEAGKAAMRVATCLLCLLTCAACFPLFAPADRGVTEEEYAVYSALVVDARSYLLGTALQPLVIRNRTGLDVHSGEMESVLARVQSSLPGVTPALLRDFQRRNARPHALESKLQVSFLYFLISEQEEADITRVQGGPDCRRPFEERYPNAQGIITLSRAGFNAQPDLALVYIGSALCKDGAGYFVLMGKENGSWRVLEKVLTWIA